MALRILSLLLLIAIWQLVSMLIASRVLPPPLDVLEVMLQQAHWSAACHLILDQPQCALCRIPKLLSVTCVPPLFFHVGITLLRVVVSFSLAMIFGTLFGILMGRNATINRLGDPWLVVLLNLPALVIIVLAYIWMGLTEAAAILAVALNKLPNATVTIREGARAIDPGLEEMAKVFAMPWQTRARHVLLPQLAPYIAAATRSGLSIVWKIVLVVELMGRSNGVGFEIYTAFQLFDIPLLLAYTLPFVGIMLAIEAFIVQPFEQHVSRWRPKAA